MYPPQFDFKYLKKKVSIAAVLADKGLIDGFKKQGDRLIGPCPIHGGDNTGAFVISLTRNVWYCFTHCHKGGDVIELTRSLNGTSYHQTAQYLAGLQDSLPQSYSSDRTNNKPFRPFKMRLQLDPNTSWLARKGIKPDTARRFEAGLYRASGFLAECIGVRLHDLNGKPLGYTGRRLNDQQIEKYGKWKFPSRFPKKQILYNFHRIHHLLNKGVVITECPWGVMRLAQLNIPAVALLGVNLYPAHCHLFKQIPRAILMLDGDHAGRQATIKIWKTLHSITNVHHIYLPTDLDPDDLHDNVLSALLKQFSF